MQAMILAAGFGTRLQPYSSYLPKPLFPLLNIPLLLLTIKRLQASGFDNILVNCHHLRDRVKSLVNEIEGVSLQEEEEILGTGGALRRALDHLRNEPLLVTNGDIYHTVDMARLYHDFLPQESKVLLAVHHCPRFSGLMVENEFLQSFDAQGKKNTLAFTGIHVVDPVVLEQIPPGTASCIIDRYRKLLQDGEKIRVTRVDDAYWTDMGTPRDYLKLHGELLLGSAPCIKELQGRVTQPYFIDGDAVIGSNLKLGQWCSIGKAEIGDNVTIDRSVIWDGAVVESGSKIIDSIVT